MAQVRLADIIEPVVYQDLAPVNNPELTAFFQSGVATRDQLFDSLASAAGKTAELPFWNDLDPTIEPNYSSDNPASLAVPNKVAQGEQIARKAFVNQSYQAMDLAREIAMGDDAMQHIRNRFGTYWMRQWQRRCIATLNGVRADNVANDGGDMVHDVAAEAIAGQGAGTLFSRSNFTSAAYNMGDQADGVMAIACHSQVVKQMADQDDVEDIRDSEGNLVGQSYLGKRIIMDDSLPVIAGATDGFKYVSILFGSGAIGYGSGGATVPVEVEREALAGDGGGMETIVERDTWILHPFGFQNTGTPAGQSFNLTELAAATSWDRVVERKNVPISFLITN